MSLKRKGKKRKRRKSARVRKQLRKSGVIDMETRALMRKALLAALEHDNYIEEGNDALGIAYVPPQDDDEVYVKRKKKRKKNKIAVQARALKHKRFDELLLQERCDLVPIHVPTYLTAATAPSVAPARHFCSVCGFESSYACARCGMRFCSLKCQVDHRDTRCLKFTA